MRSVGAVTCSFFRRVLVAVNPTMPCGRITRTAARSGAGLESQKIIARIGFEPAGPLCVTTVSLRTRGEFLTAGVYTAAACLADIK